MFYYNLNYQFALPEGSPHGGGSIIVASAMTHQQLVRRQTKKIPHLARKLFDPQLYLSGLDVSTAKSAIEKLATHPWFCVQKVAPYDSNATTLLDWKKASAEEIRGQWTKTVPEADTEIKSAIVAAVTLQIQLEVESIILPVPLIETPHDGFDTAANWIDIGIAVCKELAVKQPVYATLAIPDYILRMAASVREPLLNAATGHVTARARLAGAYLVVEQGSESGYVLKSADTCAAILTIVDDLVRGGKKKVIVNYAGPFGVVAAALGATIWASNFYRKARRMRLNDFDDAGGMVFPRYFSAPLLGDVSPDGDLDLLAQSGAFKLVETATAAAATLNAALRAKQRVSTVPAWAYEQNNRTASWLHYNEVMMMLATAVDGTSPEKRVAVMHEQLRNAAALAKTLKSSKPGLSQRSDLDHQETWLRVFEQWMQSAGQSLTP
ncbi:MAG: hypothetical protein ABJB66_20180 [Gemmatimonadaceae bacterium]